MGKYAIKENIYLFICYIMFFYFGMIVSSTIDFLGNAEAVKLSRINDLEAINKYFKFNINSYICGVLSLLSGMFIFYMMKWKFIFKKEIK